MVLRDRAGGVLPALWRGQPARGAPGFCQPVRRGGAGGVSGFDFHRDDDWQREVRNRLLAPFYGRYSREGRYVFIDKGKLATILQRRYATDTILQARSGGAICLEEKIVRWPKDPVASRLVAF